MPTDHGVTRGAGQLDQVEAALDVVDLVGDQLAESPGRDMPVPDADTTGLNLR